MKSDDLVGILKEKRGVNILKPNGQAFDHYKNEYGDAKKSYNSLVETIDKNIDYCTVTLP